MATTAFSDDFENEIINVFFRSAAKTFTTGTIYVALSTETNLTTMETWTAGAMSELPVANGYSRQAVTFNAASGGVSTNSSNVVFTCSGTAWSGVNSMALVDSAAGAGKVLMFDDITLATLNPGDTLTFAPGQITITVT